MPKLEFQDKLLFILNKGKESLRLFGDFCDFLLTSRIYTQKENQEAVFLYSGSMLKSLLKIQVTKLYSDNPENPRVSPRVPPISLIKLCKS